MTTSQVTFQVRGSTDPGEVIALCGSCSTFGAWKPQNAIILQQDANDCMVWKINVTLPRGFKVQYRYFKGTFLEPRNKGESCQVIVHKWETHLQPRSIKPLEEELRRDDGEFGIHNGVETVDSGWLTCQTELRLRLHYSEKQPVSISKKKFKKSRFRVKLTFGGPEEEDEDEESDKPFPIILPTMANTFEISLISNTEFVSRHSQPECGYALQPDRWTEFSVHTMEPDNLELLFDFFEEETVVQGDALPGHAGTAILLSSTLMETGKSNGIITLPIMSSNARQTLGKVRVDYLIIKPIQGYSSDMTSSFSKYWKPRTPLDVGHRGAGNSTTAAKMAKIQENTVASLKSAANHGAAFVEFDVHLSKDLVPVIYHDLTCCLSMKKKANAESVELFEIPVKELSYDQLQLLKLAHVTALKLQEHNDSTDDESSVSDNQPFPSLQTVLECVPEDVGFNIEIKWICQEKSGKWDGNLSTYFDMNLFLDIILKTVLENGGSRRIVFSAFDADICTMVRRKQNRYPILFLTQGESQIYPELMDLRSRSTPFAVSFAQFEDLLTASNSFITSGLNNKGMAQHRAIRIDVPELLHGECMKLLKQGINVHTEDLLKNPHYIREAKSKGLVIFCWGDDTNDPENRKLMKEYGINGLVYDRIYDWNPEQPNIFKVEQMERLKRELPAEMLRSCLCSMVNHFVCTATNCTNSSKRLESNGAMNHQPV